MSCLFQTSGRRLGAVFDVWGGDWIWLWVLDSTNRLASQLWTVNGTHVLWLINAQFLRRTRSLSCQAKSAILACWVALAPVSLKGNQRLWFNDCWKRHWNFKCFCACVCQNISAESIVAKSQYLFVCLCGSRPGSCAGDGSAAVYKSSTSFPDETLTFIKSYPLMDEAVPSVNGRPCFTRTTKRYIRIQKFTAQLMSQPIGQLTGCLRKL